MLLFLPRSLIVSVLLQPPAWSKPLPAMRASIYTALAVGAVFVAATVTLTKDGCVDASGFETCQNAATKKTSVCVGQAKRDGSGTELLACGCQDAVDNFNCYAAHCWNQVWGCQYQEYMVQYFRSCAVAKQPVPYFPAPNNAPAACSCNLGKVYSAFSAGPIPASSTYARIQTPSFSA
ncbi:hypothetical protein LMH87_010073 [Akanthomyces muscarius]|uniref:Uncharacterized protein n=1 Tax=Akanthomyces muscarius TaxID=2231603 RepID=A0A9W8QCL2_AKAMU|nr:hypothetical protein LMH87_010073 [Akanthomyces muscarius]KAJ4153590.1 hypothetical protein LMH87_010073 [Akanthomyces muscarius]